MPKGIYPRKPGQKRNYTPEQRAAMSERLKKARASSYTSPNFAKSSASNVKRAQSIRAARAILKHMPAGAVAGTEFHSSNYRAFRVIDATPQRNGNVWEQRFEQSGTFTIYGVTKTFSGIVKVIWNYEPTIENIMDSPRLAEESNDSTE